MITRAEVIALIQQYGWRVDGDTGMLRPPNEEGVEGIHLPVLTSDPSTLEDGDVWYNSTASETRARIAGATVSLGASGGGSHAADRIYDADTDTKIQAEESADEDKLRFDTGGTERAVLDSSALDLTVPVKANTISEHTGAAGVTIDGVLLKDGEVSLADSKALILGTGDDAKIYYDGTNLIIDPDAVGSGDFRILGSQHIIHAAIEDDDHALEIDVAAGNYSDIKALDIVYAAGELQAGEDDEAILVNIDEDATDGGRITGLDVLTTTSGDALVEALFAGVGVAPIEQLSGTFGNPDSALVKAANELADLINPAANTTVFVADDDTMTIGKSAKFEEIEFILSTDAGGGGIAPTFEYSTGVGAWAAFSPMDGTNGLRNTGIVAWEDSDIPGWNTGAGSEYLIRITRTRGTVPTTPVVSFLQCASATEFGWDESGDVIINSLGTDTIDERTGAAGVTIEGVLNKDGLVDGVDVAARDHAKYTDNEAVSAVATADDYLKNDANDETTGDLTVANLLTAGNVDGVDVSAHDVAATGVHGAGGDTLATDADIAAQDIADHNDTTATGTELETLTDGSDADGLHAHPAHAAAADPHTGYQKESEKDAASGYMGLDAGGDGNSPPQAHGPAQHTEGAAWKVPHTDAAGDEQETAVGADATVYAGKGTSAAPGFEEIYVSHVAVFIPDGEDLTAVSLNPRAFCVGESGEHGTFTAIPRAKAVAGTAGAGTNTILIEADDNPAFSSATTLFTLALNTSTEVDDTSLDNAWASGDIWIRARCTAVDATAPKDVVVQFFYKERAENF